MQSTTVSKLCGICLVAGALSIGWAAEGVAAKPDPRLKGLRNRLTYLDRELARYERMMERNEADDVVAAFATYREALSRYQEHLRTRVAALEAGDTKREQQLTRQERSLLIEKDRIEKRIRYLQAAHRLDDEVERIRQRYADNLGVEHEKVTAYLESLQTLAALNRKLAETPPELGRPIDPELAEKLAKADAKRDIDRSALEFARQEDDLQRTLEREAGDSEELKVIVQQKLKAMRRQMELEAQLATIQSELRILEETLRKLDQEFRDARRAARQSHLEAMRQGNDGKPPRQVHEPPRVAPGTTPDLNDPKDRPEPRVVERP